MSVGTLARVATPVVDGPRARMATIEVDVRQGLPSMTLIGAPDRVATDLRIRLQEALAEAGLSFPLERITINVAPARLRERQDGMDLAIALALLAASEQIPGAALDGLAVAGNLTFTGEVRAMRGALACAEEARAQGMRGMMVPDQAAADAAIVSGLEVRPIADLAEAVALLRGEAEPRDVPAPAEASDIPDLRDVRGHAAAIRAMEIAAVGGHSLLLEGEPGSGRTLLARRLPTILPDLTEAEALEVTRLHSLAGTRVGEGLTRVRPFRAPHHTISVPGLVGGGPRLEMGEVTLAHHGVLFVEGSEFSRMATEALRAARRDRKVTLARGDQAVTYPADFLLVGAEAPAADREEARRRERRLGPLGFDLRITVTAPTSEEMRAEPATSSAAARARVQTARTRAAARNGQALRISGAADALLDSPMHTGAIGTLGRQRLCAVAQSIADLDGSDSVDEAAMTEALALRGL